MSKHDRAKQEKRLRNLNYARRFKQRVCKQCKHRTCRVGRCPVCGGDMRLRRKEQ